MYKFDERTRQHRNNKDIDTSSIDSSTRGNQSKGVPVGTLADSKKKSVRHNCCPAERRNALANLKCSPKMYSWKGWSNYPIPSIFLRQKQGFNQIQDSRIKSYSGQNTIFFKQGRVQTGNKSQRSYLQILDSLCHTKSRDSPTNTA